MKNILRSNSLCPRQDSKCALHKYKCEALPLEITCSILFALILPFFFLYGAAAHVGPWPPLYEVP
jgi:hypothetical protein